MIRVGRSVQYEGGQNIIRNTNVNNVMGGLVFPTLYSIIIKIFYTRKITHPEAMWVNSFLLLI